MITELNKVDPLVVGGQKIDVVEHKLENYRLHQVLEQLTRLMLFLLECDSNNTASKARPRDVRKIIAQWKIAKDELEFSMKHNDLPNGVYEYGFSILLPDQKEIQRIRNVKTKRVLSEIFNTCRVMLRVDSAKTQSYIANEDYLDIMECFTTVDDCILRWMGTGADAVNTGLEAPAFEELGVLVPDADLDWATMNEPSVITPPPELPDTADTSTAAKK